MTTGIYQITNTANGYVYIGSSINTLKRLNAHLSKLRTSTHPNSQMQKDANFYGVGVFETKVMETLPSTSTDDEIYEREIYYTDLVKDRCYNKPRPRPHCTVKSCILCHRRHYGRGMCLYHWLKWRIVVNSGTDINADEFIVQQKGK